MYKETQMFKFIKNLFGLGSSAPQETAKEIVTPPSAPYKVEPPAEVKPQRAKDAKGKFVADDPSTPGVNEAWKSGKAPAKKVKAISTPIKEGSQRANVKTPNPNSTKPPAPKKPKAKRK